VSAAPRPPYEGDDPARAGYAAPMMSTPASEPPPQALQALQAAAAALPVPQVLSRLVWTAAVDVAEREALGTSGLGERFIVPIVGGAFWGGPGFESLRGRIVMIRSYVMDSRTP